MTSTMTLTTTQDVRRNPGEYQNPQSRGANDNLMNPAVRPNPGTNAGHTGTGSGVGSVRSSFGGSKSSLSSVSYAVAIPVRQATDIGKLLTDIEAKPILLETTEDLDLSMSLTKTPSLWSLNDPDRSFSGGKPPSVSSRISFASGSSFAGSAWNVVPPPESTEIIDTVTALYLPIIAIFLIGLSMLFTVVSFTNPYWMAMKGAVLNTTCPQPRKEEIFLIGFLDACSGYTHHYNCDLDEALVQVTAAIFRTGVVVFWVGLALVFFQVCHQIHQTLYIGSKMQSFELRKADHKAYGRNKGIQIIVLTGISLCAILSSLCFIISMAMMPSKDRTSYSESGINYRPSFITCGIAAALTMFCGFITSGQIFYHVSGTRAETTIALSPGVKFVKTFQAVAPEGEEEDEPEYDGEGARLEMSMESRNERSDSVDDDFRTMPYNKGEFSLERPKKALGRIQSISQKMEDKDVLMKRSIGHSQSKRTAPQIPNSGQSGPLQKSYDTEGPANLSSGHLQKSNDTKRPTKQYDYPNSRPETSTARDKMPYVSIAPGTSKSSRPTTESTYNRPTSSEARDTTIPSHYNRPRPKPSFKQVRAARKPQESEQEMKFLPAKPRTTPQSYDQRSHLKTPPRVSDTPTSSDQTSHQKPISIVADVHASGHRSSYI